MDLRKKIEKLEEILRDLRKVDYVIMKELEEIKEKFGDVRKTEIIEREVIEERVEEFGVVLTDGNIKRFEIGKALRVRPKLAVKVKSNSKILLFSSEKAFCIDTKDVPLDLTPLISPFLKAMWRLRFLTLGGG